MQDAINAQAHLRVASLGLDVDVARALIECVSEHEVDRIHHVLVGGLDFAQIAQLHELLEVGECPQFARHRFFCCRLNTLSESVDLGDRLEDVDFAGDDAFYIAANVPAQLFGEFKIERIGHRHYEALRCGAQRQH